MFGSNQPLVEFAGFAFGLREAVYVLIAGVALYMGLVLWRMRRLPEARPLAGVPPQADAPESAPAEKDGARPAATERSQLGDERLEYSPPGLADEVLRDGLEREVELLRTEVDALRGELAAMREDMLRDLAHLRATQTVSPIYGDAMQMASAGYDAAMIAERCGIARAEAELVVALARSRVQ